MTTCSTSGRSLDTSRFYCIRLLVKTRRKGSTRLPVTCSAHADRRSVLTSSVCLGLSVWASPAKAGLVQFPALELNNEYILVRAGERIADARGIGYSNPVNKNASGAELTRTGKQQVLGAVWASVEEQLQDRGAWIWASITSASYQTAAILASLSGLGQSRVVPEYSFLEPRGLGALDGAPLDDVMPILRAGDASSINWRPPRGTDGTPNESVADVMVRVRQVISITETQYQNETIVFVAPDSTVLSVLQACIQGVDPRQHWDLAFRPGEVRKLVLNADAFRDDAPVQFACRNPPSCV